MDPNFDAITLANLAEGNLEEQFQRCLAEVSEVYEESERYEHTKDGAIESSIVLEVSLSKHEETSMLSIDVRAQVKRPKIRRISRHGFYEAGAFTVPKLKQAELFERPSNVRPMAQPQE